MHRIDNSTSVTTMPTRKATGTWGYFSQGSESGGQLATIVEADILNAMMMEIANVVTKAGLALNKLDDTQLWQAINALLPAPLGFVPVEQGGGAGQGVNKVHIGWGTSGGLKVQVDATDLGPLAFLQQSQTWTQQQNFQGVQATYLHSTSSAQIDGELDVAGNITSSSGAVTAVYIHSTGDVAAGGNANVNGSVNGAYVHSAGNMNAGGSIGANGDLIAGGNMTATGSVTGAYLHSTGNAQVDGSLTVNSNVVGNYANLTNGAYGSGDNSRAVTLRDFNTSGSGYTIWPNGLIVQWGTENATNANFNFPIAFASGVLVFVCGNANAGGSFVDAAYGFALNRSQYFVATKESQTANAVTNFPVSWIAWGI